MFDGCVPKQQHAFSYTKSCELEYWVYAVYDNVQWSKEEQKKRQQKWQKYSPMCIIFLLPLLSLAFDFVELIMSMIYAYTRPCLSIHSLWNVKLFGSMGIILGRFASLSLSSQLFFFLHPLFRPTYTETYTHGGAREHIISLPYLRFSHSIFFQTVNPLNSSFRICINFDIHRKIDRRR